MNHDTEDKKMISALTIDEQAELRSQLRRLPGTMPPRAVWNRIREQAEAEGLIRSSASGNRRHWLAGFGAVAAVLLAVFLLPGGLTMPGKDFPVVPQNLPSNTIGLSTLQTLMVQSRQLEDKLRALPEQPRVMRASTVATISDLEDRIASIDYQLNDTAVRMTPEDREIFWRERVRLMKSLLALRYAQAQQAAF